MAEFKEVMGNINRMCAANCEDADSCAKCPLRELFCFYDEIHWEKADEIEKAVTAWAAEHPEPKYPTWAEWQRKIFGDSFPEDELSGIAPCQFMPANRLECHCLKSCTDCSKRPIPADIAVKLGIKLEEWK